MIADADNEEFMAAHRGCKVLCDGIEVKRCTYADGSSGFVAYLALDSSGNAILDGDEFLFRIQHGKVEIVLPRE